MPHRNMSSSRRGNRNVATPLLSRGLQASSARGRYVPPCKIRHVYHRFPLLYLATTRVSCEYTKRIDLYLESLSFVADISSLVGCSLRCRLPSTARNISLCSALEIGNENSNAPSKCRSNACLRNVDRTCTRTRRFRLKREMEGEDGWVRGRDGRRDAGKKRGTTRPQTNLPVYHGNCPIKS